MIAAIMLTMCINFTPRCKADNSGKQVAHGCSDQYNTFTVTEAKEISPCSEKKSTQDDSPRWYQSPEWILIIIGGITALVIGWQSCETRKAATAALLNAQAVINAERAWISVLPYNWSPEFFSKLEKDDPTPEGPMGKWPISHLFQAQIKNVGRTPATIEGLAIRYIRTSTHPSKLPPEPDYGELDTEEHVLIPNDEMLGTGVLTPDMGTLTKAQVRDIAEGNEFLFAYGIVKYRDVYKLPHETRFGYIYQTPESYFVMDGKKVNRISFDKAAFRHGGPPAYNRNT